MTIKRLVLAAIASSFMLGSCGGSGGSGGSGSMPQGSSPQQLASAAFKIVIPPQSIVGRAPQTVPPATQSIKIVISAVNGNSVSQGSQTVFTATLNASNPACSPSQSGLACTIAVQAPIGNDTFAVSLYATPDESGNSIDSMTITASIVAGQTNNIYLSPVLTGGPITISLSNPSPAAGTSTSITVSVSETDATGAAIVGAFANPITLTDSDASGATTLEVNGAPAATVAKSTDVVTINYSGLVIAPTQIAATTANGQAAASASFSPAIPPVVVSPTSLEFLGTASIGGIAPSQVTASQTGWTGSYGRQITVTDGSPTCNLGEHNASQLVSIDATVGTVFNITPQNVGTCALTFDGGAGVSIAVPITVSTTSITIH